MPKICLAGLTMKAASEESAKAAVNRRKATNRVGCNSELMTTAEDVLVPQIKKIASYAVA